jgi:hypothetical protein
MDQLLKYEMTRTIPSQIGGRENPTEIADMAV